MPRQQSPDNSSENQSSTKNSGASGRRDLLRYAGLSGQVAASVGVALFLGIKADKWLKVSFPIFSCGLPLLIIVYLIIKLIKESSGGSNGQ